MSATIVHNPLKIGVIHGHQCIPTGDIDSLRSIARQMDVDVLVSGHTHVYVLRHCIPSSSAADCFLAFKPRRWTTDSLSTQARLVGHGRAPSMGKSSSTLHVALLIIFRSDPIPSFALLDIQGPIVVTYVYQLIDGEVRVEKIEWRKEQENLAPKSATPLQSYENLAVNNAIGASSGW